MEYFIILLVIALILIIIDKAIGERPVIWSPEMEKEAKTAEPKENPQPVKPEEPEISAPTKIDDENEPEESEISVPTQVDGKKLAYHYEDVDIIPALNAYSIVKPTSLLTLSEHNGTIYVLQDNSLIGNMKESKIADMVRDWQKRGDPIRAFISNFKADNSSAQIAVFFYRDQSASNLRKYAGYKQYKLTGKPDDFADGYKPGDICTVEEDFNKSDRYIVIYDGDRIGYLPASAITFADNNDISPEELKVVIASVEYDDDKDRDIISVYISAE